MRFHMIMSILIQNALMEGALFYVHVPYNDLAGPLIIGWFQLKIFKFPDQPANASQLGITAPTHQPMPVRRE